MSQGEKSKVKRGRGEFCKKNVVVLGGGVAPTGFYGGGFGVGVGRETWGGKKEDSELILM